MGPDGDDLARRTILDTGVFTSVTNGDGLNFISSEDIVCRRLYIRSQDDSFCACNACDSVPWLWDEGCVPRPTRHIRLSDSMLASNARAIVLGGHGLFMRGGANVLENVEISHCRILGNVMPCEGEPLPREHRLHWSGIFRILSQSGELVHHLKTPANTHESQCLQGFSVSLAVSPFPPFPPISPQDTSPQTPHAVRDAAHAGPSPTSSSPSRLDPRRVPYRSFSAKRPRPLRPRRTPEQSFAAKAAKAPRQG